MDREAVKDQYDILIDLEGSASSTDELNAVFSRIVTTILADSTPSGGPTILAANGVWIEKTLSADEVNKEVNSWVEEQTNGLITDLLPPNSASPLTDLIFANALFFNGRWDSQFNPSLTKESDFHLLDGTKVRVPFMTGAHEDSLDVYEAFKVLNLPYREGREDSRGFSMQIYLPDEKDGLPSMLESLASTRGFLKDNKVLPSQKAGVKELKIPRFKFAFDFEASKALKGLGLKVPLSTIIHKSCIEVDEVGSKAAAAAALRSCGGCYFPPKKYDFVADHPFLFIVKEYISGLVLFLGHVMDPSKH
ncbi:putative Serpin family protein [Arabidopsis thaliana]